MYNSPLANKISSKLGSLDLVFEAETEELNQDYLFQFSFLINSVHTQVLINCVKIYSKSLIIIQKKLFTFT